MISMIRAIKYLDVKLLGLERTTMATDFWDAAQYLRYADLRARPFTDLLAQIRHTDPHTVIDLGCGPGNVTRLLLDRWPHAQVTGVDSSDAMINAAREHAQPGRLDFTQADLRTWAPDKPADVIVANAVLQWVPGHLELLPRLAAHLDHGGVLGFQVPGNFDQPSHTTLAEIIDRPEWRDQLADLAKPAVHEPDDYFVALTDAGLHATVWETTYLCVLDAGDDGTGVTEFVKGSALRPALTRLSPEDGAAFTAAYTDLVRQAYPVREIAGHAVQIMPYRRIFATGQRQD
jgi:trans-aconitate 2-methyltransferase